MDSGSDIAFMVQDCPESPIWCLRPKRKLFSFTAVSGIGITVAPCADCQSHAWSFGSQN
jgi:hypothetical protein